MPRAPRDSILGDKNGAAVISKVRFGGQVTGTTNQDLPKFFGLCVSGHSLDSSAPFDGPWRFHYTELKTR